LVDKVATNADAAANAVAAAQPPNPNWTRMEVLEYISIIMDISKAQLWTRQKRRARGSIQYDACTLDGERMARCWGTDYS